MMPRLPPTPADVVLLLVLAALIVGMGRRVWTGGRRAGTRSPFDVLVLLSLAVMATSHGLSIWAARQDVRRLQAYVADIEASNQRVQDATKRIEESHVRLTTQPTMTAADQQHFDSLVAEQKRLVSDSIKASMASPTSTGGRPFTYFMLAAGVAPFAWVFQFVHLRERAKKWKSAGRCEHCGYDLRGTPGRCPECGTNA